MKADIDIYRGWTISFDTEKETFYCHSEQWDKDHYKVSYTSIKKFIDDFIKDNEHFKPVWIESKPQSYRSYERIKLIGIRKDGRFVYEDKNGAKQQLSEYSEKDYILYNPENAKYREEAAKIDAQLQELHKKKDEVLKKVIGVELVDYKKEILS